MPGTWHVPAVAVEPRCRVCEVGHQYILLQQRPGNTKEVTSYWAFITRNCDSQCEYCVFRLEYPLFDTMSLDDFRQMLRKAGKAKLTMAGGEPTNHPQILEFMREAQEQGFAVRLCTNGIRLAEEKFFQQVAALEPDEIRLSIAALDDDVAPESAGNRFHEPKLQALRNLERHGIPTTLAPIIFRNKNTAMIRRVVEYAHTRAFVHSIAVAGLSLIGRARDLDSGEMIMPDELMDILHKDFAEGPREDAHTFQRVIMAVADLLGTRMCLYAQLMLFVRARDRMRPITDYLNMGRIDRAMTRWERIAHKGRLRRGFGLFRVLASGLRLRSLPLVPHVVRMFFAHITAIRTSRFPKKLLVVMLNTDCCLENADTAVTRECMGGAFMLQEGEVRRSLNGYLTFEMDERLKGHEPLFGQDDAARQGLDVSMAKSIPVKPDEKPQAEEDTTTAGVESPE